MIRTDKKHDEIRRVEIAMLGLLIEKYPKEARKKARELLPDQLPKISFPSKEKSP